MLGRDSIEGEKGVADISRKSKKVVRSPEGKEGGQKLRLKRWMRKLKEEVREGWERVRREMREEVEGLKKEKGGGME